MTNSFYIADELGLVRAQIAELKARENQLKAQVVEEGEPIEGDFYRATPVWQDRDQINWKAIAQKLEPSHQLITAHTKHTVVISVRVSAKQEGREAA